MLMKSNEVEQDIIMPFDFSGFVKAYLGDMLEKQAIVKPSNRDLQYIVTVKDARTVMMQVCNNTPVVQRYDIVGQACPIDHICEISLEDGAASAIGYYPACVSIDPKAENGQGTQVLAAGDVVLFEISLSEQMEEVAELVPAPIDGRGVRMPKNCVSILDFLQENPTFTEYFDTVLADAAYWERTETETLRAEARRLRRMGIRVAADFTSLFDMFPDLSFDSAFPEREAESYRRLDAVLQKIRLYDCSCVLITAVLPSSPGMDKYRDDMQRAYRRIVNALSENGTRVIFLNRQFRLPRSHSTGKGKYLRERIKHLCKH